MIAVEKRHETAKVCKLSFENFFKIMLKATTVKTKLKVNLKLFHGLNKGSNSKALGIINTAVSRDFINDKYF